MSETSIVTYHVEPWAQYYNDPECLVLWQAHYQEFQPVHLGHLPFGPDVATYEALDRAGALVCLVARRGGRMIGYCLVLIKRHLHYNALCGFEDSYYLAPAERRGWTGYRLLERAMAECRRRGTRKNYWQTKDFLDMSKLLEHLGARHEGSLLVTEN